MRRQPEGHAQRAIVQLLSHVGCLVWTLGTTRRRGDYHGTCQSPGLPDLIAHLPNGGGVLFVEVKAKGGRLRPSRKSSATPRWRVRRRGRRITSSAASTT